jgi:aldehyde:ferredoxin oxidoreductase
MEYLSSNKIAVIDLGSSEIAEEELDEGLVRENIGGAGINRYLYHKYESDDPLVIGSGLLTGTLVAGSALAVMTAKSPRTGSLCHAPITLTAGMELKFSGFDYLVIKGVSSKPVFLWLHDGIADIQDAGDLWGKDTWEATESVRKAVGDDLVQVLAIGPAGERGSGLAQVGNNYWASGDTWGFGKLLGRKKLKLIAVRGMGLLEIADPEGFIAQSQELLTEIKGGGWAGKAGIGDILAALGEEDGPSWLAPLIHRHKACFNTPYAANTFVFLDEDPKRMTEPETPEPGMLLTRFSDLLGFKQCGLSALESGRILKECARMGLDGTAVSSLCLKAGLKDLEGIRNFLPGADGPVDGQAAGPFSSFAPGKPLFADFGLAPDGSQDAAWWARRQAVAYLFGIHPLFILMAPELTEEKLLELANLGTGLEVTAETLDQAISEVVRG